MIRGEFRRQRCFGRGNGRLQPVRLGTGIARSKARTCLIQKLAEPVM